MALSMPHGSKKSLPNCILLQLKNHNQKYIKFQGNCYAAKTWNYLWHLPHQGSYFKHLLLSCYLSSSLCGLPRSCFLWRTQSPEQCLVHSRHSESLQKEVCCDCEPASPCLTCYMHTYSSTVQLHCRMNPSDTESVSTPTCISEFTAASQEILSLAKWWAYFLHNAALWFKVLLLRKPWNVSWFFIGYRAADKI